MTNRTLDIDEELRVLEQRKIKLQRLIELRKDVSSLEGLTLTGAHRIDTATAIKVICEEVCREFGLNMEILGRKSRQEYIAIPRFVVFYLSRQFSDVTLQGMGRIFDKGHGTVLHGCQKVADRMDTDKEFAATLARLKSAVQERLKEIKPELP